MISLNLLIISSADFENISAICFNLSFLLQLFRDFKTTNCFFFQTLFLKENMKTKLDLLFVLY